jgi:hypothetical protein
MKSPLELILQAVRTALQAIRRRHPGPRAVDGTRRPVRRHRVRAFLDLP